MQSREDENAFTQFWDWRAEVALENAVLQLRNGILFQLVFGHRSGRLQSGWKDQHDSASILRFRRVGSEERGRNYTDTA